jgi:D-serine deaminase-like pyridoxal phosphate-dependent protein
VQRAPALVLDLDAFHANLDLMANFAARTGVKLRPHAKTHKSPVIAKMQMARGAVGQCVQKVGEAENSRLGRRRRHPGEQCLRSDRYRRESEDLD